MKLKTECGSYYTNKIESMFKEILISNQIMIDFKQKMTQRFQYVSSHDTNIAFESQTFPELEVKILTMGKWPLEEKNVCKLPDDIISSVEFFERFLKLLLYL